MKVTLEADEKAVGRKDSGDLVFNFCTVLLTWENTVLDATSEDARGGVR